MKLLSFILPFGRSRLVRSGNPPRIVIRVSGCAAVGLLCLLSAFRAWSADCVSHPAGLVSWWQGEGNAADIAGTNNGILEGGVAFAAGEVGQAFSFDGVSGCITNAMPGLTNIRSSYTMEFWAWPTAARASTPEANSGLDGTSNQRYAIFPHYGDQGFAGAGVSVGTNGVSVFEHTSVHLSSLLVYNAPIVGWTHIAVVYQNQQPALYINGALARTGLVSDQASHPCTSLGGEGYPPVNQYGHYAGLLDEVSIYNRPLSASEIQEIYSAGSAGKCVPPPNCIPPPSGLVGWWPGEGNANDIAGTNNGTLLNNASFALGEVDSAFSLDGVSAVVQVPDSPTLNFAPNSAMTVELWAYRTTTSAIAHLLGKRIGCTGSINYQMAWDASNGLNFGAGFGNGVATGISLPLRAWTHLAATFETGTCRFYINGQLVATATGQTLGSINNAPLTIGDSGSCECFGGLLDEVSIYDRALSASEIAAIYNAGSAGKCQEPFIPSQPRGQVGYWGKIVTLTVTAAGATPLSYQWLKNGTPVVGASGSSLVLTNLQLTDAGNYSVVVTNAYGSITSSNAYLTMNPAGVSLALYSGFTIDGVVGLTYGIQYSTDLSNTNGWRGMANITLGTPTELWFDVQPASQPQRYYRIVPGPISLP